MPFKELTAKQSFQRRFDFMKREFDKRVAANQELSTYINPTRGIFNGDRSKIGRQIDHKTLISSYATHAQRIAASGLNSGMTNKSTRWFKPTFDDPRYLEIAGARQALDELENRMYAILNQSNSYNGFYNAYEEMLQFGPACFLLLADFEDVIRVRTFTCGEYFLGTDNKGRVNAFAREFEMTVEQMVQEFGLESVSPQVKAQWDLNNLDETFKVCHMIEENVQRDAELDDFENMPFRSVYWEKGHTVDSFLAKRGFKRFPVIAPRWETITTDDVYGYSQGWHAIGSIKELQVTRGDKLKAQEKYYDPPTLEDSSVDGHSNTLPGGKTKVSNLAPNTGVRAAYQINLVMDQFMLSLAEIKEEIDRFFFVNLFLMLVGVDKNNMTATEVAERQQEKIMMLGPVLHRLDEEMLTPFLTLLYGEMQDADQLPEFPPELEGVTIKIEYTSILAQAQKALGIQKIEHVLGIVAAAYQVEPSVIDNINFDEVIRQSAEMEGAPAKIITEREDMAEAREQKAQQQNAAMAMQMAQQAATTTKDLAAAKTEEPSALTGLVNSLGGGQ